MEGTYLLIDLFIHSILIKDLLLISSLLKQINVLILFFFLKQFKALCKVTLCKSDGSLALGLDPCVNENWGGGKPCPNCAPCHVSLQSDEKGCITIHLPENFSLW